MNQNKFSCVSSGFYVELCLYISVCVYTLYTHTLYDFFWALPNTEKGNNNRKSNFYFNEYLFHSRRFFWMCKSEVMLELHHQQREQNTHTFAESFLAKQTTKYIHPWSSFEAHFYNSLSACTIEDVHSKTHFLRTSNKRKTT